MKTKKYLVFLLFIMLLGINTVSAEECYYTGSGFFARYNTTKSKHVTIDKVGMKLENDTENFLNTSNCKKTIGSGANKECIPEYSGAKDKCPEYLVLDNNKSGIDSYEVYAFTTISEAQTWANKISGFSKHSGLVATHQTGLTKEQYEKMMVTELGNIDDPLEVGGTETKVDCSIFGSKNDENSIAYLVNEVMNYMRIIVPVLIILLGSIDFFKAVVSKNAEDMKKHQMTFVKRIIAGIVVFLAPILVNIVMYLADMIWSYGTPCSM